MKRIAANHAQVLQRRLETLVGGNAPGHRDPPGRVASETFFRQIHGAAHSVGYDIAHRILERGAKIGHIPFTQRRGRFGAQPESGLETCKRKTAQGVAGTRLCRS